MNRDAKKIVKIVSLSLFFLFIVIFAFINSRELLFGIKIKDVNIVDGSKVTSNLLDIKGKAKNAVNLTLDGREISIDKDGNFTETIALSAGYNIVTIRARDKFGNVDEKDYKLTY